MMGYEKNGTQKLFENLTYIINKRLIRYPVPEQWEVASIFSIHQKGTERHCNNYRGISVTSTLSRLYGQNLQNLIEDDFRENEEVGQSGLHAGKLCTVNFKQVIEKWTSRDMETRFTFIDIQKQYDTVPTSELTEMLNINYT